MGRCSVQSWPIVARGRFVLDGVTAKSIEMGAGNEFTEGESTGPPQARRGLLIDVLSCWPRGHLKGRFIVPGRILKYRIPSPVKTKHRYFSQIWLFFGLF